MHTHANAFLKAIILMLVEGHATFGDRKNAAFELQQYQETIPIVKKVNKTLYHLLMYNCDINVFKSDKKQVTVLLFEFITKHRDQCKFLISINLKGNSVINSYYEEYIITNTFNIYFKINPGKRERRQRKTAFKYTYHISTEEESSDSDFEKPKFNFKRSKTSDNHETKSNSADPGPDFTYSNSKPKTDFKSETKKDFTSEPSEPKTDFKSEYKEKLKPKQSPKYTLKSFDPSFCFDEHRYKDLLTCNIEFDKDDVSLIECSLSDAYHKFDALKLNKLLLKYHPDKSSKSKYESISGSLISKIILLKKHIQKNSVIYITSSDDEC